MKEAAAVAAVGTKKVFNDAIHAETIKKELRYHRLKETYMLTPGQAKRLVFTNKPTGDRSVKGEDTQDAEYLKSVEKSKMSPQELYPMPITNSQSYGWDTQVLMRNTDRRFHFPRVVSDVSKIGEMLGGAK